MKHLKRVGMFLFNWIMILTMPLWVGFFAWVMFARDVILDQGGMRKTLTGKDNLFKDMMF